MQSGSSFEDSTDKIIKNGNQDNDRNNTERNSICEENSCFLNN